MGNFVQIATVKIIFAFFKQVNKGESINGDVDNKFVHFLVGCTTQSFM